MTANFARELIDTLKGPNYDYLASENYESGGQFCYIMMLDKNMSGGHLRYSSSRILGFDSRQGHLDIHQTLMLCRH